MVDIGWGLGRSGPRIHGRYLGWGLGRSGARVETGLVRGGVWVEVGREVMVDMG
jgi:hypothetical protein